LRCDDNFLLLHIPPPLSFSFSLPSSVSSFHLLFSSPLSISYFHLLFSFSPLSFPSFHLLFPLSPLGMQVKDPSIEEEGENCSDDVDDITSLKVTALPDYDSTGMGMGTDGVSTSTASASGVDEGVRGDCNKAAGVTAAIADSSELSVAVADVVTMVPPGKIIHIYRKNGKISYFNVCCVVLCCVALRFTDTGCLSCATAFHLFSSPPPPSPTHPPSLLPITPR
jgi:hypothetical protein